MDEHVSHQVPGSPSPLELGIESFQDLLMHRGEFLLMCPWAVRSAGGLSLWWGWNWVYGSSGSCVVQLGVSPARSLCQQDCSHTASWRGLGSSIRPFRVLLVHRCKCLPLRLRTLQIAGILSLWGSWSCVQDPSGSLKVSVRLLMNCSWDGLAPRYRLFSESTAWPSLAGLPSAVPRLCWDRLKLVHRPPHSPQPGLRWTWLLLGLLAYCAGLSLWGCQHIFRVGTVFRSELGTTVSKTAICIQTWLLNVLFYGLGMHWGFPVSWCPKLPHRHLWWWMDARLLWLRDTWTRGILSSHLADFTPFYA